MEEILGDVLLRAAEFGSRLLVAVVVAGAVVGIGRLVRPALRRALERGGRPSRTRVFVGLFGVVVAVVAILLAATLAFPSVRVAEVLGGLGVISVAAGFAFKDILENLLAGVLLLVRDPFKSGDQIRVGEHEGTVEGVTIRETLLRTHEGQLVLIPNAQVYTSALEVLTHYPATRNAFRLALDASTDVATVREVLVAAVSGALGTTPRTPEVVAVGLEHGALAVEVRVWSGPSRAERTAALDRAITAALRALHESGIALDEPTPCTLKATDASTRPST